MKTDSRSARGVNRPRGETISRVPAREFELSTRLNRLIGEANCEAALLPTRRTISEWTSEEVHEAVARYEYATVTALLCAIELQALDSLDAYSKLWIHEATQKCREHHELLEFIRDAYFSSALEND